MSFQQRSFDRYWYWYWPQWNFGIGIEVLKSVLPVSDIRWHLRLGVCAKHIRCKKNPSLFCIWLLTACSELAHYFLGIMECFHWQKDVCTTPSFLERGAHVTQGLFLAWQFCNNCLFHSIFWWWFSKGSPYGQSMIFSFQNVQKVCFWKEVFWLEPDLCSRKGVLCSSNENRTLNLYVQRRVAFLLIHIFRPHSKSFVLQQQGLKNPGVVLNTNGILLYVSCHGSFKIKDDDHLFDY